jgi:hypothetical protein
LTSALDTGKLRSMVAGVLSSPRRRRRLCRLGATTLALGAVVAFVVLAPTGEKAPPDRLRATTHTAAARTIKLDAATRAAINRTLDVFVPGAVSRNDTLAAWALAGPGLRAGTAKRDWASGDLPVQPYPVRAGTYHGWRKIYATEDRVALDLLLHPRKTARVGPIAVAVDLVREGDRWLVDAFYPTAVFNDPDKPGWVAGSPDYTADGGTADATYRKPKFAESRLAAGWFVLPLGVLACGLLAAGAYVVMGVRRTRRAYAAHEAAMKARAAARR